MPKVHSVGPLFVQVIDFPVEWGHKVVVRGWTQEIEPPFRTAEPLLVRLPNYKALALGRWTGKKASEEDALNNALQRRDVTYDDFQEEAGWTDPDTYREAGSEPIDSGSDSVDGARDVHGWEKLERLVEVARSRGTGGSAAGG